MVIFRDVVYSRRTTTLAQVQPSNRGARIISYTVDSICRSDTACPEAGGWVIGRANDTLCFNLGHSIVSKELLMALWQLRIVAEDLQYTPG